MKDELFHIASVKEEFIAKALARKVYAKFGWDVMCTDSSSFQFYSVDVVDNGALSRLQRAKVAGYAEGVLEMLLSILKH
jgi:hypothetical protein